MFNDNNLESPVIMKHGVFSAEGKNSQAPVECQSSATKFR